MDEVETRLWKERGEKVVDLLREKRDLCKAVSLCQGVGRFHLEFVLVDADTLEIGILPRHRAQPFTTRAADFQDGVSVRQVACREQFPGQQFVHLLDNDALKANVVVSVVCQFFMRYHWRFPLYHSFHSCRAYQPHRGGSVAALDAGRKTPDTRGTGAGHGQSRPGQVVL